VRDTRARAECRDGPKDKSTSYAAQIWTVRCHLLAKLSQWSGVMGRGEPRTGERTMTTIINDILLFSCMLAFVTGLVIAAASLVM
jgi:hypothetical protein